MAINLSRNTKVYFTTRVDSLGTITDAASGWTTANLYELQVLDGYSFSQNTESTEIGVNEAGTTAVRGTRQFNTALAPVDWSISTYVRPVRESGRVDAAEKVLWNAMFSSSAIGTTGLAVTNIIRTTTDGAARAEAAITSGTALNFTPGDVIAIQSIANAGWNQQALVKATASSTSATIEFLRAPGIADGFSSGTATAYVSAWGQSNSGSPGVVGTDFSFIGTLGSQRNQLQRFGLIFKVDNVFYGIDNCVVNQASIDFGLDQIATIAWSGQGVKLKRFTNLVASSVTATTASSSANYITNKLSTVTMQTNIGGNDNTTATTYDLPITGGNITINNNVTYLTPSNLGVVNQPVAYFTGNRSVTGNITAYLKTGGTNDAGTLLNDLITGAATTTEPKYRLMLHMGGTRTQTSTKVDFEAHGATLQIPTVDVQDVVSTTINFKAAPFTPNFTDYDIERSNELLVKYYSS